MQTVALAWLRARHLHVEPLDGSDRRARAFFLRHAAADDVEDVALVLRQRLVDEGHRMGLECLEARDALFHLRVRRCSCHGHPLFPWKIRLRTLLMCLRMVERARSGSPSRTASKTASCSA